jgi:hypothetical protein
VPPIGYSAERNMNNMKLSRRNFLLLGIVSGMACLCGAYIWRWGDAKSVVVAILKRRVGYLDVDPNTFHDFAKEYLNSRKQYEPQLTLLSAVSLPLRFASPYRALKPGHAFRRLEDNIVSQYLLSTDFFQNGADENRSVQYLSFYDLHVVACRNPFSVNPDGTLRTSAAS